jgi:hypothetical protein
VVTYQIRIKLSSIISSNLTDNVRNALVKGAIVGIITAAIYLTVVVMTTPNLPSNMAMSAAFKVNGIIIVGLAIGIGIQVFASSYSKGLGCRLDKRIKYTQQHKDSRGVFSISGLTKSTGSSGSTIMSSFLSFFSLVPLGCCGSWLFVLSMLPSVFGGTVSVILIKYSTLLSYIGLVIVLGLAGFSLLRLKEELIERRMLEEMKHNQDNKNPQKHVR